MILRAGEPADRFYIIRHGKVGVEVFAPEVGPITIETLGEGDVLGWSWLFPPYRWVFDARALELTRAIALDGKCLREKCDEDPRLGYDLMKRFAQIMVERLQATRLQLIDLYSPRSSTP
jgi:CRP-like cAMP-binding protein